MNNSNKSAQCNLGTGPRRSPKRFYIDGGEFIFGPRRISYSIIVAAGRRTVYFAAATADRHTPGSLNCSLHVWPRRRAVLKIDQAASLLLRNRKSCSKNRGTKKTPNVPFALHDVDTHLIQ